MDISRKRVLNNYSTSYGEQTGTGMKEKTTVDDRITNETIEHSPAALQVKKSNMIVVY